MSGEPVAGGEYIITHDINISGRLYFQNGEAVRVDTIADPPPSHPDSVCVVTSRLNGLQYRLSARDLAEVGGRCPRCSTAFALGTALCGTCGLDLIADSLGGPFSDSATGGPPGGPAPPFGGPAPLPRPGPSGAEQARMVMSINGIVEGAAGLIYSIILMVAFFRGGLRGMTFTAVYMFLSFLAVGILLIGLAVSSYTNPEGHYGLHMGVNAIAVFLGNLMLAALIAIGQAGFFSFVSEVWQAVLMMIALLGGGIASIVLVTAARRHLPVRP